MVGTKHISWPGVVTQAVVAGIVGAIALDVFLWAATIAPSGGSIATMWQWIASTAFGKGALTNPSFAAIGAIMHLGVSIGWAGGYAFFAATRPVMSQRWPVSGIVYGIVVWFMMQIVLLVDANFVLPASWSAVAIAIVAHCVFFGLPVALIVRLLQSRVPAAT